MPNTPARLGTRHDRLVRDPGDDRGAARAGGGAASRARRGARGRRREARRDGDRGSGTGPTYVFLVMEALIDAAVHLGFPRHIAHDLVIETLEGSTLFAKQRGMHPAELRNMVTSPGGTSAAALHELESGRLRTVLSEAVWAAYRRTRRARRAARGGRRPRPQVPMTTSLRRRAIGGRDVDLRRAPLSSLRAIDLRAPDRDCGPTSARLWDRFTASWAGLDDAAWRLAGAAPSDAGGPDWSLLDHIGHVAYWQELAIDYVTKAEATGIWPTDEEFDGGDFDRYNERHRTPWDRLEPAELRRRAARQPRATARRSPTACPVDTIRGDDGWGWVYMTLHGHTLDHLGVIEPWADRLRDRQAQHDPFVTDPRPASGDDWRRSSRRSGPPRRRSAPSSTSSSGSSRSSAGRSMS